MGTAILPDPLARILVAMLIGFLIGLDRERAEVRVKRHLFAGVRTFPLIALIGAATVLLVDVAGPWLVVAGLLAVGAVALVSYVRSSAGGTTGATTEIASIGTFLLGALAGSGELFVAGAVGIIVAVLLVAKPRLEGFSQALSEEEMAAALELAIISCIVLPLLPKQGYGPWGVWNPFGIWLVVVLVSGVSFAGFVAVRVLGQRRGLALAGVVGGFVSSTAVTAAMANRSRQDPKLSLAAAAATVLGSTVVPFRVGLFAAAFGPGILLRLLPVLLAMALVGVASAYAMTRRVGTRREAGTAAISNPFSLFAALSFGLLYAVILLGVRAAQEFFGAAGMYLAAALSGLVDVDAVTIAFASNGPGADFWRTAAAAVSLALVMNTIVKAGLAVALGHRTFRTSVALALGVVAVAGAAAAVAVFVYL